MPELPDLAVVAEAFNAALAGRPIVDALAPGPLAVRGTPGELAALIGQRIRRIERTGKFIVLTLERDRVVVNPMLSGRFQLARAGAARPARTALVLALGGRPSPPADPAPWTAGAPWLPADEASLEVRFRDPTQMGKVYLLPAGVQRAVPGFEAHERGPDADDPDLTIEVWQTRIRRHSGELKNLLRNQAFVAGIGNAYSDEILHAARLLPFRRRSSLASEEVDELYTAMRRTLTTAVEVLRERVPPTFERQVRDFFAVHGRGGLPCPRCGGRISQLSSGGFVTSFCRACQR